MGERVRERAISVQGDPAYRQGDEISPDALGALGRLGGRRGGRVPHVQQLEAADCGAACLAMVAGYHGHALALDDARRFARTGRGTDALSLIEGAEQLGLRGRGVRIELDALPYLPRATILHWDFNHFVVFERVRRGHVELLDPAFGRRRITLEAFGKHFTGVALVFEPTEAFVPTPPGDNKVWGYLAQLLRQRSLVARIVTMSIALRLFALALPILTAMVVDRVVPRGDEGLLMIVGAGMAALLIFQVLSTLIRSHLLIQLRTALDIRMTIGFVTHLLSLPYAFFTRRSAGDLLLRVQSNTQIRDVLTSSLLSSLLDGALAALYLVLLFLLSPLLAGVTAGLGAAQALVLLAARRRYRELTSQDLESMARAHSQLAQMMAGIETLKISGAESRAIERWSNLYVDEINIALQRSRLTIVIEALNGLIQMAAPLLLLGLGAMLVLDGDLTLGTMLATTALATGFLIPLKTLIDAALQMQTLGGYVERIDDVLRTDPEQRRDQAIAPPRLSGDIEVRDVSFRYGPNDPMVVRGVSFRISRGETIALVGRSGSGKSTLAALLLGLHRPTEGRILLDGYDLAELDHRRVRQQLGMVPQHPFVFAGPIRENLALGDPTASFERITAAARRACIHDDIIAMPMGYETYVADGGSTLSGGQRQRLALARALLHDPAVLVLDEATSALDTTTERQVIDNLTALRCTRIVIAHRLSTVIGADRIIVLDEGRIVELGSHAELLGRGGHYAALVADQAFTGGVAS